MARASQGAAAAATLAAGVAAVLLAQGAAASAADRHDFGVQLAAAPAVAADTYDVTWRVTAHNWHSANLQLTLHVGTGGASTLHVERDGVTVSCSPAGAGLRCSLGPFEPGESGLVVHRVRTAPGGHALVSAFLDLDADSSNNLASVTVGTPPTGGGGGGGGGDGGGDRPKLPASIGGDYVVSVVEVPAAPIIDRPTVVKIRVRFTALRWWTWGVWLHATETAGATVSWPSCPRGTFQSDDRCRLRLEGTESEEVVQMQVIPRGPLAIVTVALAGENMVDADPSNDVVVVRLEAVPPANLPLRFNGTRGQDIIEGTRFADVIEGKAGNDNLFGHGGNDVLRGGPGNDYLHGGFGRDVLEGGPGNDLIAAREGFRDRITCGPGRDRVIADPVDVVAPDCEVVTRR